LFLIANIKLIVCWCLEGGGGYRIFLNNVYNHRI